MGLRKMVMAVLGGALMLALTAGVALALNQINCGSLSQDPLTPECNGTPQQDSIEGREANDVIYARGEADTIGPASGNDDVYGGGGGDTFGGSAGNDRHYGGGGPDRLFDTISAGDSDELRGGKGADILDALDGDAGDLLICGPGDNDTVHFDRFTNGPQDSVDASCENKRPNEHPQKS